MLVQTKLQQTSHARTSTGQVAHSTRTRTNQLGHSTRTRTNQLTHSTRTRTDQLTHSTRTRTDKIIAHNNALVHTPAHYIAALITHTNQCTRTDLMRLEAGPLERRLGDVIVVLCGAQILLRLLEEALGLIGLRVAAAERRRHVEVVPVTCARRAVLAREVLLVPRTSQMPRINSSSFSAQNI